MVDDFPSNTRALLARSLQAAELKAFALWLGGERYAPPVVQRHLLRLEQVLPRLAESALSAEHLHAAFAAVGCGVPSRPLVFNAWASRPLATCWATAAWRAPALTCGWTSRCCAVSRWTCRSTVPARERAMHEPANLYAWDAVVAAFLNSRHAIGRAYVGEEQVLRHLRSFLVRSGAVDLDTATFDRWRRQFQHLSASTRVKREHAVYKLCRYRRRTEPECFLPNRDTLARQTPHALPTIVGPNEVARLLAYVTDLPPGSRHGVSLGTLGRLRWYRCRDCRLLERHGWRKVVPRPRHPTADVAAQVAFKKAAPRGTPRGLAPG